MVFLFWKFLSKIILNRFRNPYCSGLINPSSIPYLEILLAMIFAIIFNPLFKREIYHKSYYNLMDRLLLFVNRNYRCVIP